MSERIVNDPSQHGWVEVDGKWMWGASGGSGGSIQDGDTEGQITTWDGTEWTPEGVVVVSDGNVGIGSAPLALSGTRTYVDGQATGGGFEIHSGGTRQAQMYSSADGTVNIGSFTDQPLNIIAGGGTRITVDSNGRVDITGKLFVNGQEVTGGGGGGGGDSFWVEESPGVIKYTGTAKATDVVAG